MLGLWMFGLRVLRLGMFWLGLFLGSFLLRHLGLRGSGLGLFLGGFGGRSLSARRGGRRFGLFAETVPDENVFADGNVGRLLRGVGHGLSSGLGRAKPRVHALDNEPVRRHLHQFRQLLPDVGAGRRGSAGVVHFERVFLAMQERVGPLLQDLNVQGSPSGIPFAR